MSKQLTYEQLQALGARRRDGSEYAPPPKQTSQVQPAPTAPASFVVEAPIIDTEPIAAALGELLAAMQAQGAEQIKEMQKVCVQPVEVDRKPEKWVFTIERDQFNRIKEITATAATGGRY